MRLRSLCSALFVLPKLELTAPFRSFAVWAAAWFSQDGTILNANPLEMFWKIGKRMFVSVS